MRLRSGWEERGGGPCGGVHDSAGDDSVRIPIRQCQ